MGKKKKKYPIWIILVLFLLMIIAALLLGGYHFGIPLTNTTTTTTQPYYGPTTTTVPDSGDDGMLVMCESSWPKPTSQADCTNRIGCSKLQDCIFIPGVVAGIDRCECLYPWEYETTTTTVPISTTTTTIGYCDMCSVYYSGPYQCTKPAGSCTLNLDQDSYYYTNPSGCIPAPDWSVTMYCPQLNHLYRYSQNLPNYVVSPDCPNQIWWTCKCPPGSMTSPGQTGPDTQSYWFKCT